MERPPPGTPLQLRYLVNALVRVTEWFELGLQLGIEHHVLKRIEQDNRGQTERCKSAMLNEWLNNGLDHTWEQVDTAIKAVKRRSEEKRRREEEKTRQHEEERKTLEAISQVQKSIETMNSLVDQCAVEKRKVAKKLEEKNIEWESFKRRWQFQDKQWKEQEERRQQIREAIAAGDLESEVVKRYLREKSVPTQISNKAVESWLRKDILDQEAVRAKELLTRHQDTNNHQRDLTHLQEDSEKWIDQLEDHRKTLERDILSHLEQMGLKLEKLKELQKHLKELMGTLKECKSALEDCARPLEETEDHLRKLHSKLHVFSGSLNRSIKELQLSSKELQVHRKEMVESIGTLRNIIMIIIGFVCGAKVGALLGAPLGEVGESVGVFFGGILGGIAGAAIAKHRKQLETLNVELTASEEIGLECQRTEENTKQLLQTLSNIR